ncbi:MAG: hypothetical protein J6K72_12320 [Clostridia bacterium]|nr:hypothetical protein [Clostridia bacterium]
MPIQHSRIYFWLLLPAVQVTGKAITGCATVGGFILGLLLDKEDWRQNWSILLLQAICVIAFPLILFFFADRGGGDLPGFFVRNAMLWFPLVFFSYAQRKSDSQIYKGVKTLLLVVLGITALTTIGWLIIGPKYENLWDQTYCRLLGNGAQDPEKLKLYMRRNIAGYDFIYASVLALPMLWVGIETHHGWKRAGYSFLLLILLVMIVLSEYTYAMLYSALILVIVLLTSAIRRLFRLRPGTSMLLSLLPLVVMFLLRIPLLQLAIRIFTALDMAVPAGNLTKLLQMFQGTSVDDHNRLVFYQEAWESFSASPLIGSVLRPEKQLSYHSDLLDLLSGVGLLGMIVVAIMFMVLQYGLWKNAKKCAHFPHLVLMGVIFLIISALGTVFYSRDVFLIYAASLFLVAREKTTTPSAGPGEDSNGTLPNTTE